MVHFRSQVASSSASSHIPLTTCKQCVAACCSVLQCVAVCCSSASSHIPLTTCKHSEIDIFDTTKFTMCNETVSLVFVHTHTHTLLLSSHILHTACKHSEIDTFDAG